MQIEKIKCLLPSFKSFDELKELLYVNNLTLEQFKEITGIDLLLLKSSFAFPSLTIAIQTLIDKITSLNNITENLPTITEKNKNELIVDKEDKEIVLNTYKHLLENKKDITLNNIAAISSMPKGRILRTIKSDPELEKIYKDDKEAQELTLYENTIKVAQQEGLDTGSKFTSLVLDKSISNFFNKKVVDSNITKPTTFINLNLSNLLDIEKDIKVVN